MYVEPPRYLHGLPNPGRCLVMGVLNVTPDSFSDGGHWREPDAALEHGRALLAEGADLIDVGGESTRPGATRPVVAEELDRVMPVVTELAAEGAVISVDTMRAEVADAALAAGAALINDVSGGLADPEILEVVAARGGAYAGMHWRAHADTMQQQATYDDVVDDVTRELSARVEAALGAGIEPQRLALDPGLGFAKTAEHNWTLLAGLDRLHELGFPLLVGSSRKTFLGRLLAEPDGTLRPALEREEATSALTTLTASAGAWCVRVHQVRGNLDAVRVAQAWARAARARTPGGARG
jgi:dihydropteroate synthase